MRQVTQSECSIIYQECAADPTICQVIAISNSSHPVPLNAFPKAPSPEWLHLDRPTFWHGDKLDALLYVKGGADHLSSKRYFSLAVIPFAVHRRRCFAVFENRIGATGTPNEGGLFDPGDMAFGELGVALLSGLLDVGARIDVPRELIRLAQVTPSLSSYLKQALEYVRPILGAFRGDACWKFGDVAMVAASSGPSTYEVGKEIESRSVTGWVLQTGQSRLVPIVFRMSSTDPVPI